MTKEKDHAKEQALAQFECIAEMIKALNDSREAEGFATYEGEEVTAEDMQETISQDPLEVGRLNQYFILLCTGGPAVRIIGNLDEHSQPETAQLQYQDWGTPWTEFSLTPSQEETLIDYAQEFYFEEAN